MASGVLQGEPYSKHRRNPRSPRDCAPVLPTGARQNSPFIPFTGTFPTNPPLKTPSTLFFSRDSDRTARTDTFFSFVLCENTMVLVVEGDPSSGRTSVSEVGRGFPCGRPVQSPPSLPPTCGPWRWVPGADSGEESPVGVRFYRVVSPEGSRRRRSPSPALGVWGEGRFGCGRASGRGPSPGPVNPSRPGTPKWSL